MRERSCVRVRVPASTSNLGAGFDCIGLALDRYLSVTYEPGPGPLLLEHDSMATPADALPSGNPLAPESPAIPPSSGGPRAPLAPAPPAIPPPSGRPNGDAGLHRDDGLQDDHGDRKSVV